MNQVNKKMNYMARGELDQNKNNEAQDEEQIKSDMNDNMFQSPMNDDKKADPHKKETVPSRRREEGQGSSDDDDDELELDLIDRAQ